MESSSAHVFPRGHLSYLALHHTPSRLTSTFNLTSVKFESCDDNWGLPVEESFQHLRGGGGRPVDLGDTDCLYGYNRFAKVRERES